jgi:glycosyltransferase involved in cell wall biosynthesis
VFTTTANGKEELPVEINAPQMVDGVKVTYFKRLTKDHTHFSPSLLFALRKAIDKRSLNKQTKNLILHIHVWWNLVSVFSCFLARMQKVPVVLTPRGTLSNYSFGNRNKGFKYYIHRYLGKSLLEYCHIQVTSEHEKRGLLKLVTPKGITVIPNFVYLPELSVAANHRNQKSKVLQLLFLSRIEEKKGIDILFLALSEFTSPFQLTIAGSGEVDYIKSLKTLADKLNISQAIIWVGQLSQEEKWGIMQAHDLMVLPSHDENFANVVIECLATGTPVLISNLVGLADYVKHNDFGWICKVDKDSIKQELLDFTKNPEKARRVREHAPVRIREDFNEEVLVKEFLRMYSTIANEG